LLTESSGLTKDLSLVLWSPNLRQFRTSFLKQEKEEGKSREREREREREKGRKEGREEGREGGRKKREEKTEGLIRNSRSVTRLWKGL
jgi:flagellar biosynthesis/type III secretory pathway protein FliH